MKTIKWKGYDWITQESWGIMHPDKPEFWYDETAVSIDKEDNLHLKTHFNPKFIEGKNSNIGAGLVCCMNEFGYGIYHFEAKLPHGKNLWPAIWLWSLNSWPPEIDIVEAYSNECGNYFAPHFQNGKLSLWKLEANIHFKDYGVNSSIGSKRLFTGIKHPHKDFIKYTLIWTENYVEILINDVLNNRIPISVGQVYPPMRIVINNGIRMKRKPDWDEVTDFIIKDFSYIPL